MQSGDQETINGLKKSTSQYQIGYRREIDGLRAVAVLSVVAFHAFPTLLTGGFVGVDVFFVISGFLITSHIFERLDKGTFSFADFFQRRIRRIFPALLAMMIPCLVFGYFVLLSDEFNQLGLHVVSGAVFVSNFVFAAEAGYFDAAAELKPMLHLWSLAVEEQFYILWPLALWLAWKVRFNLLALTLFVFVASLAVNLAFVTVNPVETFFWPFGRLWELLSGSLLAWFVVSKKNSLAGGAGAFSEASVPAGLGAKLQSHAARSFAGVLGLGLLIVSIVVIDTTVAFPSYWAILPVLGAILVIHGGAQAWGVRQILTNRVAVWFGLISYPLYLWHWPVLSFLHILEDGTPHRDTRIAGVILSILLAWLTFRFIEKPIRFGKLTEPARTLWLSATMVAVGVIAFAVSQADFRKSHTVETVFLRDGLEHRIGSSSRWFEGTDDWLFLGNSYENTVAKLLLASPPPASDVEKVRAEVEALTQTATRLGTRVGFMIGPNKSSIYPEYLPPQLEPASERYVDAFARQLDTIPNLVFHDPTADLLRLKASEGKLYYRTDTHWNYKGAFLAYKGLLEDLGLPVPEIEFTLGPAFEGGLIELSGLQDHPLHTDDNWLFDFVRDFSLEREFVPNVAVSDAVGPQQVVTNSNPLSEMTVWVLGDSFANAVRPFVNAGFREVHHKGHWRGNLQRLSKELEDAKDPPDLLILVRVERSF